MLITGPARSGTSLTAGILQRHGLDFGNAHKRMKEHTFVRNRIVKKYLREIGADPLGQNPLPELKQLRPEPQWRNRVIEALDGANAYKGAKMLLMWPLWVEHFPEAKWVIVRRDRESLLGSLMRTGFMKNHSTREGWNQWIDTHEKRIGELRKHADTIETWPRDFIADAAAFLPVATHCGLSFDPGHVRAEIDPALYR